MAESIGFINKSDNDTENKLLLKEKEACDRIVAKRKNEVNTLNNKTEYDKLLYHFESEHEIRVRFKNVKNDGIIDLEKANKNRQKFGSNLSEIKMKNRSINPKSKKYKKQSKNVLQSKGKTYTMESLNMNQNLKRDSIY